MPVIDLKSLQERSDRDTFSALTANDPSWEGRIAPASQLVERVKTGCDEAANYLLKAAEYNEDVVGAIITAIVESDDIGKFVENIQHVIKNDLGNITDKQKEGMLSIVSDAQSINSLLQGNASRVESVAILTSLMQRSCSGDPQGCRGVLLLAKPPYGEHIPDFFSEAKSRVDVEEFIKNIESFVRSHPHEYENALIGLKRLAM